MSEQENSEPDSALSHEDAIAIATKEQKAIDTKRTIAIMAEHGLSQTKLMGLLSDMVQYGAFTNAVTVVALGQLGNAAQKAFIAEMNALEPAEAFLAAIKNGDFKIPALDKGVDAVMSELGLSVKAYLAAKAKISGRNGG